MPNKGKYFNFDKDDITPTDIGVGATAGVLGGVYSLSKPSLSKKQKDYSTSSKDYKNFKKKLKTGDVLITGPYEHTRTPMRVWQIFHNRNSPEYHTAVVSNKRKDLFELGPSKERSTLRELVNEDTVTVLRPKLNKNQYSKYINNIKYLDNNFDDMKYSYMSLPKAIIADKLHLKNVECSGDFCSNIVAKQLPDKMFKVKNSSVLPKHFLKNKNFEEIAKLENVEQHLPLSNKSILKYIIAPSLIAAGVGHLVRRGLNKNEQ